MTDCELGGGQIVSPRLPFDYEQVLAELAALRDDVRDLGTAAPAAPRGRARGQRGDSGAMAARDAIDIEDRGRS